MEKQQLPTQESLKHSTSLPVLTDVDELIANIIAFAIESSNSMERFDRNTPKGRLKIAAWNMDCQKIPPDHLLKVYRYANETKKHSGMVTGSDMIQAWKGGYGGRLAQSQKTDYKQIEKDGGRLLGKIYQTIGFEKQREIYRKIIGGDWYAKYSTGTYIPTENECDNRCSFENTMYYWTDGERTLCNMCLARELNVVI